MTRLLLLILLLTPSLLPAQKNGHEQKIRAFENNLIPFVPVKGFPGWNIEERMKYYGVPGVSIAVINNYKLEWAKAYGYADTSKKLPVTTNTLFSAGSISKLLLATAAMKLVEQGRISLDDPINNFLKSWKVPDNEWTASKPITLRMLLSHTAGTTQSSYFGFTPDKDPLPTVPEILRGEASAESRPVIVNSEPGKEFRYSGGGSMIAQLALMDVSGKSFEDLTNETLFKPLGMQRSTFAQPLPPSFQQHAAWAYSAAPWFKGMPYVYPQAAAAGLYSTPSDLARLVIGLQHSLRGKGKLLDQATAKSMMQPQVTVSDGFFKEQVGIGPFLLQQSANREEAGRYFEFTGVNAGFTAYLIGNIAEGYGAVIMMNWGDDFNGLGMEIRRAIAKTYNWKNFLPPTIEPVELPASELDAYAGRYRRGPDEVVYLDREKSYMVERINQGREIYCFPIARDTLVLTDFNVKAYFGRDDKGRIISFQTAWQDQPMPRMKDDEFTPGEHLLAGRWTEAKAGYRDMKLNGYALSFMAYDFMNRKPLRMEAARVVLELALEQHPQSAIVQDRWGDYYHLTGQKAKAMASYRQAIALDPDDKSKKEKLKKLESEQ